MREYLLNLLFRVEFDRKKKIFQEILRGVLSFSIESMGIEVEQEDAMIIEDLDTKHSLRCKLSRETAEEMGFQVVQDWPACSTDLNIIEKVWGLLKKNVSKHSPKSAEELERLAQEECLKFEFEHSHFIKNLVNSFPRCLKAVIKAKGWYPRY